MIALIGAILVGVLIVLQIKFTEYMQFANPGYAIKPGTISKYLNMNPLEQDPEKNVDMYSFKAADILYEHKKSLFFDEDKNEGILEFTYSIGDIGTDKSINFVLSGGKVDMLFYSHLDESVDAETLAK